MGAWRVGAKANVGSTRCSLCVRDSGLRPECVTGVWGEYDKSIVQQHTHPAGGGGGGGGGDSSHPSHPKQRLIEAAWQPNASIRCLSHTQLLDEHEGGPDGYDGDGLVYVLGCVRNQFGRLGAYQKLCAAACRMPHALALDPSTCVPHQQISPQCAATTA